MRSVAMVLMMGLVAAAAAAQELPWPPAGDIQWDCEYTPTALPKAAVPAWAGDANPGTEARLEDGALRIVDTTSQQGSLCRFHRYWRVDPAKGGVVEARIKLIDNTGRAGVGFMVADGVNEAHLTLYPDHIDLNLDEHSVPFVTTDDYHVYRVAVRGNDLMIWIDGKLVLDGKGLHTHPAHAFRKNVAFGSGSSLAVSDALYSAIRYKSLGDLPMPERMDGAEDVIVYKKPDVYACFPYMYQLEDGTLVASFGTRVRRSHMDSTGGSAVYVSTDLGRTWQPHDGPRPQDPARRCADGSYVHADAHGWRQVPEERRKEFEDQDITVRSVREGVVAYLQGAVVRRSEDGVKWTSEELELPAHRSLMTYTRVDMASLDPGLRVNSIYGALKEDPKGWGRAFLLRSDDDGKTWSFLPLAADPEKKVRFNETALGQNAQGDLIAMIRAEPPEGGYLWTTHSTDKGLTWAPPQETKLWGYPAHLLRLKDGRMVCSYGYRREPMGVRACISDDGKTWDPANEVVLRCDGEGSGSDMGYPISVETEPGHVFTIYYMTNEDGITHIAGTHWDVPEK